MNNIKRSFSPTFKAQVALDLIRETDTIANLCSKHAVHPTQAGKWKSQTLQDLSLIFSNQPSQVLAEKDELIDRLYRQIGKLQVELDWLKKKTNTS